MILMIRSHLDPFVQDKHLPFDDGGKAGTIMKTLAGKIFPKEDVVVATLTEKSGKKMSFASVNKVVENPEDVIREHKPDKIILCGGYTHSLFHGINKNSPVSSVRGKLYYLEVDGEKYLTITTIGVENLQNNLDFARDFIADAEKLANNNSLPEPPEILRVIPQTQDELADELAYLSLASAISLDIETSNYASVGARGKILPNFQIDDLYAIGMGALMGEGHNMSYSLIIGRHLLTDDVLHITARQLRTFFSNYEGNVVLHNALFDLPFLIKHLDYNFFGTKVADTMLIASQIDERVASMRIGGLGLKFLSTYYFNLEDYAFDWDEFYNTPDQRKDWDALYYYLGFDTHATIALYKVLNKELYGEYGLQRVLNDLLFPACIVLSHVILNGMPVDRAFLKLKGEEYTKQTENLFQFDWLPEDFNPNSPAQVKQAFRELGRTITTTNEQTISHILANTTHVGEKRFCEDLLEYRKISKLVGTYFEPLLEQSKIDGNVHGKFSLRGTRTGRLSSFDPNLQNIPKTDNYVIRQAFYAPKGYKFVEVDYSQLELRVMAILSGDENFKQVFQNNEDLHAKTAGAIFGKHPDMVTADERALAKIFNFGMLYGRGPTGIVNGPEMQALERIGAPTMTLKEARKAIDAYFEAYPGIHRYMENTRKQVAKKFYVESLFGRVRRFPVITKENWWRVKNQAVNMPDQSTAGDFTLWSIVTLYPKLREKFQDKCQIINTVHDSILFIIKEDIMDEAIELICDVMENVPIDTKGVPITVDVDYGDNWGQLEEYERK